MRKCIQCEKHKVACVVSEISESCEQCYRFHRSCDLSAPFKEIDKAMKQVEELSDQIAASEAKSSRLRKQKRLLLKRLKEMGAREEKNVEELEADGLAVEQKGGPSDPATFSEFDFSAPLEFPWSEEVATLLDASSGGTVV